jgi:hypothetical protein
MFEKEVDNFKQTGYNVIKEKNSPKTSNRSSGNEQSGQDTRARAHNKYAKEV